MHTSPSPFPSGSPASIAPRLLAATLGSYLLCFAFLGALQALLPTLDNRLLTLLPFVICAATTFWAFAGRDAWLVWLVLLLPAALCAGITVAVI